MATGKGMALFQQTVLTQPLSAMDKVSFKNFIGPFKKILDCTRFDIDKLSRKLQSWYEPPKDCTCDPAQENAAKAVKKSA